MIRYLVLAIMGCALAAAPAEARWRKAESDHFVIYANDSADDLQRFAESLEKYHGALTFLTGRPAALPSPSNRVTIYVVGSDWKVSSLAGSRNIAGFYVPRAGMSAAFVPNLRHSSRETDFSMTVLLHEYAHHFMHSSTAFALPRWLSEGGAEFFASALFPNDGTLHIGRPAYHRAGDLFYADEVPIRELLDYDRAKKGDRGYDALYGRSWLLYHYLTFEPSRKGQLRDYAKELAAGRGSLGAAEAAFGDLDRLEDDLDDYLDRREIMSLTFPADAFDRPVIAISELSDGMDETMPLIIRSKRGVDREEAEDLLPKIRDKAEEYPRDPGVLAALAEAEFDAGNDAEAIAAADRAIAGDPSIANAYVQKGYAMFRMAGEADDPEAAYGAAMAPFTALNGIENDHPLPLIYYYRSFTARGEEPTELARHALERAGQLSPFDHGLAMNIAVMLAGEGKIELARDRLGLLAVNPHGGALAEAAGELLDIMAGAPEGEPMRISFNEGEPTIAERGVDAGEDDTGES